MNVEILELFAEAQSWAHYARAEAEARHDARMAEARKRWEAVRRVKLATDPVARKRRADTKRRYERKRWKAIKASHARRLAHNAKRMAAYYRSKAAK